MKYTDGRTAIISNHKQLKPGTLKKRNIESFGCFSSRTRKIIVDETKLYRESSVSAQ